MANPFGDIADFFSGLIGGSPDTIAQGATALPNAVQSWFASIGGQIGSGIEAGLVAFLKDWWDVFIGPFEVFVGALLIIFALVFLFKDDLMQAGAMIGMLAL